jgi:hypothetical protein
MSQSEQSGRFAVLFRLARHFIEIFLPSCDAVNVEADWRTGQRPRAQRMSESDQSRRCRGISFTSALALRSDIHRKGRHVSKVPLPELAYIIGCPGPLRAISRILGVILWKAKGK